MNYREQLAEAMVPDALELAFLVHTGNAAGVREVLGRVHPVHLPALAVVLAGMVDIDKTPEELLGWVPFPESADTQPEPFPAVRPVTPAEAHRNRRELAAELSVPDDYEQEAA